MADKLKRFSDYVEPPLECEEKIDKDAILDLDIEWVDFQELSGKHGDYIWIIVKDIKSKRTLGFTTGSKVVIEKLRNAKKERRLPLLGKLVKPGEYYDIM